jgi:dTDP-4-amino-4,6-dideoxygalactose transaminase
MVKPFFLDLDHEDKQIIHDSLDQILTSGILILGPFTRQFESDFAAYVGGTHAVCVNSGTSALEILLTAFNVAGKKVAVPTNTNFATPAAVIRAGGIPVFMDMDRRTFCSNLANLAEALDRQPDLAGVLWVHIGGVIAPDMLEVARFCRERGLFLLEDCAHAHGSRMAGQFAGTFGDGGAFSFFPTKVMTTMEGGMIVTNDAHHAMLARSLRNQGKRDGDYNAAHVDLGNSWRMSELSAAIGVRQLGKLPQMIARRAAVARIYENRLAARAIAYCPTGHMDQASQYKFMVTAPEGYDVAAAKAKLRAAGIVMGGTVYDVPCHRQPVFGNSSCISAGDLRVAEEFCPRQLCPPITSGLAADDAEFVGETLGEVLGGA